jgi:hypothetical protein
MKHCYSRVKSNSPRFTRVFLFRVAPLSRHPPVDGLHAIENKGNKVALKTIDEVLDQSIFTIVL